jgi:hypothetical protein
MLTRCKFRVLHVTEDHDGAITVVSRPVTSKSAHNPEGSEENAAFWKFTPSGEASLRFAAGLEAEEARAKWRPNSCWYVDLDSNNPLDDPWTVSEFAYGWSLKVVLNPKGRAGRVEVGIDNPAVIAEIMPVLAKDVVFAAKQRLTDGSKAPERAAWGVRFTPASITETRAGRLAA